MLCVTVATFCAFTITVQSALTIDQQNNQTVYSFGSNFCNAEKVGAAALSNIANANDRNKFSALLSDYKLNYYTSKLAQILINATLYESYRLKQRQIFLYFLTLYNLEGLITFRSEQSWARLTTSVYSTFSDIWESAISASIRLTWVKCARRTRTSTIQSTSSCRLTPLSCVQCLRAL